MKNTKKLLYTLLMIVTVITMSMNAHAAIKLNKTTLTLIKGQTYQLKAKGTSEKPTWSSKNNSIASVSKNGLVKAKSKGKTTIIAKFKNVTCKALVKVETPVLSKKNVNIRSGKTFTLKLRGNTQKIKWSSSNKKVAKVSSKGIVTTNKPGTAKITAKVGNKKYVCKVTVKERSSSSSGNNSVNDSSGNVLSDEGLSENILSDDGISGNILSDDDSSGNNLSDDSSSGNSSSNDNGSSGSNSSDNNGSSGSILSDNSGSSGNISDDSGSSTSIAF